MDLLRRSTRPRIRKLAPLPEAQGPHISFKRDPVTGRVTGYEEYDAADNAVKRFRGEGRLHGGQSPPLILEPRPGQGSYAKPKVLRAPHLDELPQGV